MDMSQNLKLLMFKKQIRTTALARKIGVPQPTLYRIVEGITPSPNMNALTRISEYFDISIDQLKGNAPIPWLTTIEGENGLSELPIWGWDALAHWPKMSKSITAKSALNTIAVNTKKFGENIFALTLKDASMEPLFAHGTTLLLDTKLPLSDRCFALVKLHNDGNYVFRQVLTDAGKNYLKALSPELENFKMVPMSEKDTAIGVLVQSRQEFTN